MGTFSICASASGSLYSVREAEVGSRILLFDRASFRPDLHKTSAVVRSGSQGWGIVVSGRTAPAF